MTTTAPAPVTASAVPAARTPTSTGAGAVQARPKEAWPDAVLARGNPWQPAIMGWIVMALLLGLAAAGLTRLKRVPGALQNLWEFVYEWVEELAEQVIGPEGPALMPYFFSAFVFILACNLLGLIPYLASPTARTDTTVALALCTFGLTHVLGLKRQGWGYVSHYFHLVDASLERSPLTRAITTLLQWVMLPLIEFIGELARPLSLSMRLFGNIFAKEVLLMVLAALVLQFLGQGGKGWALVAMPLVLRPGILVLGVLVSLIQAAVFVGLSMIYVGGALAGHGESGHGGPPEGHPAGGAHAA